MDGSLISFNGLIAGNRIFDIPVYQRSYAWEKKNLEDLWEDLYFLDPAKKHFFGTVLLKDSGKTAQTTLATLKRLDVIDGQQRLTSVLILIREIISQLKMVSADRLRKEVEDLEKSYFRVGSYYKLNLLGVDDWFFRQVIIGSDEIFSENTDTPSQRRLANAMCYFRQRLIEEKERQPSEYQNFLVQLKRKVDDLQLIQYQVASDADAIRIFETVNDRGRPLSNLEKTKSFLMHTSYLGMEDENEVAGRLEELNNHFSGMYRHFDDVSGTKQMERLRLSEDDVQRYHFINYISPRENDSWRLLDTFKNQVRNMLKEDQTRCVEYAHEYTRDLEQAFFTVKSITDAYKEDTDGEELTKLFMLGRIGNIFPLLIASWLKFGGTPGHIKEICRLIEAFIVRVYLVGRYRSNTARSLFYRVAYRVHQGDWGYERLADKLKDMNLQCQTDWWFRQNLCREDFYNGLSSRNIKYFLSEYEIFLRTKGDIPLSARTQERILTSDYQVEHIWAQHPPSEMSEGEESEHRENIHRLGNLTIASQSWNNSMGNKPFEKKRCQPGNKPSYSNSSLQVQKELAELTMWDVEGISNRETKIIDFALQRWRV